MYHDFSAIISKRQFGASQWTFFLLRTVQQARSTETGCTVAEENGQSTAGLCLWERQVAGGSSGRGSKKRRKKRRKWATEFLRRGYADTLVCDFLLREHKRPRRRFEFVIVQLEIVRESNSGPGRACVTESKIREKKSGGPAGKKRSITTEDPAGCDVVRAQVRPLDGVWARVSWAQDRMRFECAPHFWVRLYQGKATCQKTVWKSFPMTIS